MNPLGLSSCSIVLPDILSGEEVASLTVAPKVPWLGLRILPAWARVPALPALLPSWGVSTAYLGMSTCIAFTPRLRVIAACLGMSACTACTPSWLGGLMVPAWEWAPALPALLLAWRLVLPAWDWVPALPALLLIVLRNTEMWKVWNFGS